MDGTMETLFDMLMEHFKGMIVIWSGTVDSVPDGWVVCDGNNGTPDLGLRLVMGTTGGGTPPGTLIGEWEHYHMIQNHKHDIAVHKHTHDHPEQSTGPSDKTFGAVADGAGAARYDHLHPVDLDSIDSSEELTETEYKVQIVIPTTAILPQIFLCYIMKT